MWEAGPHSHAHPRMSSVFEEVSHETHHWRRKPAHRATPRRDRQYTPPTLPRRRLRARGAPRKAGIDRLNPTNPGHHRLGWAPHPSRNPLYTPHTNRALFRSHSNFKDVLHDFRFRRSRPPANPPAALAPTLTLSLSIPPVPPYTPKPLTPIPLPPIANPSSTGPRVNALPSQSAAPMRNRKQSSPDTSSSAYHSSRRIN